jgi:GGDEF domain-containing protein
MRVANKEWLAEVAATVSAERSDAQIVISTDGDELSVICRREIGDEELAAMLLDALRAVTSQEIRWH